jgi:hypothetical protein
MTSGEIAGHGNAGERKNQPQKTVWNFHADLSTIG